MKKGFEVANTNQPMAGAIQMKSGHGELEARGRRAQGRKGVVDVGGGGKEWHRDCWCVGGEKEEMK